MRYELLVEGKGFVGLTLRFLEDLGITTLQKVAERGLWCHQVPPLGQDLAGRGPGSVHNYRRRE